MELEWSEGWQRGSGREMLADAPPRAATRLPCEHATHGWFEWAMPARVARGTGSRVKWNMAAQVKVRAFAWTARAG